MFIDDELSRVLTNMVREANEECSNKNGACARYLQ